MSLQLFQMTIFTKFQKIQKAHIGTIEDILWPRLFQLLKNSIVNG
jgi:hypothetical protein